MSVWLHDVGKVVTPLEVMDKARRLSPLQETQVKDRLEAIRLLKRIDCLEGRITRAELEAAQADLDEAAVRLDEINRAGFVPDEQMAYLDELKRRTYRDQGEERPWLTEEEYAMLSIRRGTLSAKERKIMENHVVITDKLLSQIRFSEELSHVREWAAAHHELLNGSGYPLHKTGEAIPYEVRIITILWNLFEGAANLTTINFTGTEEQWNSLVGSETIPSTVTVNVNCTPSGCGARLSRIF